MYQHSKFTLIELMFTITVLVILIGIGFVAGTKVLRSQAKTKTRAELKILTSACYQYKDRFGNFPDISGNEIEFNFINHLSDVSIDDIGDYKGQREMYINLKQNNINSESNTALDPYENPYMYKFEDGKIKIWSLGLSISDPLDDVYN